MLINFSVENYRSIRSRQTLSLVAGSSRSARERHGMSTGLKPITHVLRCAGIFGPNGSGKTSFVSAMDTMRDIVVTSARESNAGDQLPVQAFLMDDQTRDAPSEFEVVFVVGETIYQYGFAADYDRVHGEWLFATPKGGRLQRWIDRRYLPDTDTYDIYVNPSVHGERRVWKEITRPNSLLLSTAVQFNSEHLKPIYDWIRIHFRVIRAHNTAFGQGYTASLCTGDRKSLIVKLLRGAGIEVSDIEAREVEFSVPEFPSSMPDEVRKYIANSVRPPKEAKIYDIDFVYKDCNNEDVRIPLDEESDGTQMLFSLIGPLLDTSDKGFVLVIDELHRSLHPLAFKYIIDKFFVSSNLSGKGQIVFTSHETYVLEDDAMHRDEVWFVDKKSCSGSSLTPLSEFKVRSGEMYRSSYLRGRYGGIPAIRHFDLTNDDLFEDE